MMSSPYQERPVQKVVLQRGITFLVGLAMHGPERGESSSNRGDRLLGGGDLITAAQVRGIAVRGR